MSEAALSAWVSLYLAVGLLSGICALLALLQTTYDIRVRQLRPPCRTWGDLLLFIPRLWLRWQIHYLKGAPVILAVALGYAWHLGFDVLGAV